MAATDYRVILGANIREERKRAKLTQEWLAEKTGLSTNFLSRVERGEELFALNRLQEVLRMQRPDRRQVGIIEGGQQVRFVDVHPNSMDARRF